MLFTLEEICFPLIRYTHNTQERISAKVKFVNVSVVKHLRALMYSSQQQISL